MRRKSAQNRVYLVWLEWPEKCFRIDNGALAYLKSAVPAGSEVVRAKSRAGFLRALSRATHVITWYFEEQWFALAPKLQVLATPSAGRELVPENAPPGVKVHFGGFHGQIIAESVVGFMMAWSRGFFAERLYPSGEGAMSPRVWLSSRCRTLAGTKAVIAGYGKIGKSIGAALKAFSCSVEGISRKNIDRLPEAVKDCSWFVMALPSTTNTDDFLDAALIRRLPRDCVVINVGRGNSIDEKALLAALRSNRLAGAYLDVAKVEPLKSFRSLADCDAGQMPPNLVLMPHASAFSPDYLKLCFKELKDEKLI